MAQNGVGGEVNLLYLNFGHGTFSKVTSGEIVTISSVSHSAIWSDYNNDGFVDLFVADETENMFFENTTNNGNNWVKLDLMGTASNPEYTYTAPDSDTVSPTVTNSGGESTIVRENYIFLTGLVSLISMDEEQIELDPLNQDRPVDTTSFYPYNGGSAADSIWVTLDPGNVNPPEAISVFPESFEIAPNDSALLNFAVDPSQLNPGPFLTPAIIVDAQNAFGENHFERTIRFRIIAPPCPTAIDEPDQSFPAAFQLFQNYPNPFNPSTTITYALPKAAKVIVTVYDILGRQVRQLVAGSR